MVRAAVVDCIWGLRRRGYYAAQCQSPLGGRQLECVRSTSTGASSLGIRNLARGVWSESCPCRSGKWRRLCPWSAAATTTFGPLCVDPWASGFCPSRQHTHWCPCCDRGGASTSSRAIVARGALINRTRPSTCLHHRREWTTTVRPRRASCPGSGSRGSGGGGRGGGHGRGRAAAYRCGRCSTRSQPL